MHRFNAAMSDAIVFAEFTEPIPIKWGPFVCLDYSWNAKLREYFVEGASSALLACRCHLCEYWVPCGFIVDYKQVVVVCKWSVEVNRQVCPGLTRHGGHLKWLCFASF